MTFEHMVRSMENRMKVAASIGLAIGHARSQKDYATAAALLSILQDMPQQGLAAAGSGTRVSA